MVQLRCRVTAPGIASRTIALHGWTEYVVPGAGEARNKRYSVTGQVWAQVHAIVRTVPPGRVTTYGQIAHCLGHRISPLAVGWALHAAPPDVPWHRVVNARGGCSTDDRDGGMRQRRLLEAEGVVFDRTGRVDLTRFGWS